MCQKNMVLLHENTSETWIVLCLERSGKLPPSACGFGGQLIMCTERVFLCLTQAICAVFILLFVVISVGVCVLAVVLFEMDISHIGLQAFAL